MKRKYNKKPLHDLHSVLFVQKGSEARLVLYGMMGIHQSGIWNGDGQENGTTITERKEDRPRGEPGEVYCIG
jgi:hypothetical protein